MPSDTYILTVSEAGVSVPSSHASTHITGGSDVIPTATSSTSGLMSAAIFNQHVTNTAKVSNITHTGDVTDAGGVLTVGKINGVSMAGLATGILKNTTSTGVPSIAVAADFPTLNQNTTGTAATATTATNLASGSVGSVPYQTAANTTAMLSAGTAGQFLKSNGAAAPVWGAVNMSTDLTGTLPVDKGGTGAAILSGILKGNGTNAFTAVTEPAGDLVGTTATQTLTNKTLGSGTTIAAIGTPTSGTLTNCTGLPLTTGVTGTLPVSNGGTGQTVYTIGDVLFASTSTALSKLADVATGNALLSGGVGIAPAYGKVGLTTHVDGTLPVANGGTGAATLTGYVKGTGTTAMTASATVPVADVSGLGTGVATFLATPSSANLATAVTGETGSGALVFATSPTLVTPILGTPAAGSILTNCTGLPLTAGVTGILPVANGGTNQVSVARGQISKMTSFTAVTVSSIGTYYPLGNGGTLDTTVSTNMILGATSTFSIRNTSGATRVFRIYASVDATASADDILGIMLYVGVAGSLTARVETECRAYTNTANDAAKLVTSWMISLANNEQVAVYVANHSAIQNITAQRARIVAQAVL